MRDSNRYMKAKPHHRAVQKVLLEYHRNRVEQSYKLGHEDLACELLDRIYFKLLEESKGSDDE